MRYAMQENALLPDGNVQIIVEGFHNQATHAVKPFEFDQSGGMYVNIGVPSNACQAQSRIPEVEGLDPCPFLEEYGGVWRYLADETNQHAYKDGTRYATGIRNGVANAWHAGVNRLYVVQHGRDDLHRLWPDRFTEEQNNHLPAEEFLPLRKEMILGGHTVITIHSRKRNCLAPSMAVTGKLSVGAAKQRIRFMDFQLIGRQTI